MLKCAWKTTPVLMAVQMILLLVASCGQGQVRTSEIIRKDFSGEILDESKKSRVFLLPLKNLSDRKKYPGSDPVGSVLFNGVYNAVGYFPSFDVPEKTDLTNTAFEAVQLGRFASNWNADYIVFGDYELKGDRNDPTASLRLVIWSKMTGEMFTNTRKTRTDTDIFDAIDRMIAHVVKVTLNEEVRFAVLDLSGFSVGRERYNILINNKLLASVTNDGFSVSLKVLPDRDYNIKLVRLNDRKRVMDRNIAFGPGTVTRIGYEAKGIVKAVIVNQKKEDPVKITLDGTDVTGQDWISNVPAGRIHILRKMNLKEGYSYQTTFFLPDGGRREIPLYDRTTDLYDLENNSAYVRFYDENILSNGRRTGLHILHIRSMTGSISMKGDSANGFLTSDNRSNTIYFWGNRDRNNIDFRVIIADRDNELFLFQDWSAWRGYKRLEIPFTAFRLFVWQQSEDLNGEIDYPIRSVYFNNGTSSFTVSDLYFNSNRSFARER